MSNPSTHASTDKPSDTRVLEQTIRDGGLSVVTGDGGDTTIGRRSTTVSPQYRDIIVSSS